MNTIENMAKPEMSMAGLGMKEMRRLQRWNKEGNGEHAVAVYGTSVERLQAILLNDTIAPLPAGIFIIRSLSLLCLTISKKS